MPEDYKTQISRLQKEINAIYDAMAARNGFLNDAEFDAIQSKHAEIEALLDRRSTSPTNTNTPNA